MKETEVASGDDRLVSFPQGARGRKERSGLPIVGHVRPLEANDEGPWPKILNHTLPEPSHVATFAPEGTLAR